MELAEFANSVPEFGTWSHTTRVKAIAWYLHTYMGRDHVRASDVDECFRSLNVDGPSNTHRLLVALTEKSPKEMLRRNGGFVLEARIRADLDARLGQRPATIHVHKLLADLPARLPSEVERVFLEEALRCLRSQAFRAAIVMAWNLAFDHLCHWIIKNHLTEFNARVALLYPGLKKFKPITKREDFAQLDESQVIDAAGTPTILTGNLKKVLNEKLTRRNLAAHPSEVVITQPTAEDVISDLVENVVLKLT